MIKKIVLIIILFLAVNQYALAHPGRTDSSGCHTCRTNCSSWGLSTGEYHCHNAKAEPQPQEPIRSTYGANGTGYISPAPEYKSPSYTAPSRPSCPSMSSYDSLSGSCKCFSGYVVDKDFSGDLECVSGISVCQKTLGYGSRFDSLSEKCECNVGYILSGGKCKSEMEYCRESLGNNSEYNSLYDKCECRFGYKLHVNKCIEEDEYCSDSMGSNTRYNSGNDECECDYGYIYNGSGCILEEEIKDIKINREEAHNNRMDSIEVINKEENIQSNEITSISISKARNFFDKLRFWKIFF